MTNYTTKIEKHIYNGWTAETTIPLETLAEGERVLEVTTLKHHGVKVATTATVFIQKERSKETIIFQDYRETVAVAVVSRATEKSVLAAHEKALEMIQPHIDAAKAQYGITA